jgi:hypothetical protein
MKSEDKIAINSIGVDTRTFAKSLNEFGRQARAVHKVCLKLHIAHLQQTVSDRKAKEKTMPLGPALFRHRRRTNQIERQLKKSIRELERLEENNE